MRNACSLSPSPLPPKRNGCVRRGVLVCIRAIYSNARMLIFRGHTNTLRPHTEPNGGGWVSLARSLARSRKLPLVHAHDTHTIHTHTHDTHTLQRQSTPAPGTEPRPPPPKPPQRNQPRRQTFGARALRAHFQQQQQQQQLLLVIVCTVR